MSLDESVPVIASASTSLGSRSTLGAQVVRVACKALSVIVLARIVSPADHGLFAMAASVTFVLVLFRDLGLGTAAVQAPVLSPAQGNALCFAHAGLGGLLMLATWACAPVAVCFYRQPVLLPLLAVMGVAFLFMGLGGFSRVQLARELRFADLARIDATAAVLATAAMIAAALRGAGAYSFAVFLIVSEALTTVLAIRARPIRPRLPVGFSALRPLYSTGTHVTAYHVLNQLVTQVDTIALGRAVGAHALGLYNRSFQLLALGHQYIIWPLNQNALATLARLEAEPVRFRAHAAQAINVSAHLFLPLATCALVIPGDLIRVALGAQWHEAVPVLQALAVNAIATTAIIQAFNLTVAAGRAARLTPSVVVVLPVVVVAVLIGLRHGAIGVAVGLAATNLLLVAPRIWWLLRNTPFPPPSFARAWAGPVALNAAFGGGVMIARLALSNAGMRSLVMEVLAGVLAAGLLIAGSQPVRAECREVFAHLPFLPKAR